MNDNTPKDADKFDEHDAEAFFAAEAREEAGEGAGELTAKLTVLERELEDARNRSLRLMADFQNYQRRALQNEATAKSMGAAGVVQSVIGVLDHFDMALHQGTGASAEQVMQGLRAIHAEFLKALTQHGVRTIEPAPNDEFVPGRHEAVMQQPAEGVLPGRVARAFQTGYAITMHGGEERVLRAAKVVVAPRE